MVVFSCANQDQPLDHVRFDNLRSRLSQNSVQEKLTRLWIDHCLRLLKARPPRPPHGQQVKQLHPIPPCLR